MPPTTLSLQCLTGPISGHSGQCMLDNRMTTSAAYRKRENKFWPINDLLYKTAWRWWRQTINSHLILAYNWVLWNWIAGALRNGTHVTPWQTDRRAHWAKPARVSLCRLVMHLISCCAVNDSRPKITSRSLWVISTRLITLVTGNEHQVKPLSDWTEFNVSLHTQQVISDNHCVQPNSQQPRKNIHKRLTL